MGEVIKLHSVRLFPGAKFLVETKSINKFQDWGRGEKKVLTVLHVQEDGLWYQLNSTGDCNNFSRFSHNRPRNCLRKVQFIKQLEDVGIPVDLSRIKVDYSNTYILNIK